MNPLYGEIAEAGMALIEEIIQRVQESKMADAQRSAAILANFQSTQQSLASAKAEANAELDKIKNS